MSPHLLLMVLVLTSLVHPVNSLHLWSRADSAAVPNQLALPKALAGKGPDARGLYIQIVKGKGEWQRAH